MAAEKEWFRDWFNSPYYHILYKNHDHREAKNFINNLNKLLHFKPTDTILDVACGKGRHAIYLNKVGLEVTGIDLGPQNIEYARQFANSKLHFFVHDMRNIFQQEQFDIVVNLFTSFGYFDTEEENILAITAISAALKSGGSLIVDFLNPNWVIPKLVSHEKVTMEGIQFDINRSYKEDFLVKEITFEDQGKQYQFEERVRALRKSEFMSYFEMVGLKLKGNYGDYDLNPYHWKSSPRMIFILEKE